MTNEIHQIPENKGLEYLAAKFAEERGEKEIANQLYLNAGGFDAALKYAQRSGQKEKVIELYMQIL